MAKRRFVGVNERGYRVGEDHHRSRLSNADVDMIHLLHEAGLTYRQIIAKLDHIVPPIGKSTIHDIVTYRGRAQRPERFKLVNINDDKPAQAHRVDRPEEA